MDTHGKDYTTVRQLRDYLRLLPADTCVDLPAKTAVRKWFTFSRPDHQDQHTRSSGGEWNVLSFDGRETSTASELLKLLESWVDGYGYAGVMRDGAPIRLPAPAKVSLPDDEGLYRNTKLNHRRSAAAILSAEAAGDPQRAHELLAERFGRTVAAEAVLYAVGPLWHGKGDLLRLYPGLQKHGNWERLFPRCDAGCLRRCVVNADVLHREFGAGDLSPVDRLLACASAVTPAPAVAVPIPSPTPPAPAAAAHAEAPVVRPPAQGSPNPYPSDAPLPTSTCAACECCRRGPTAHVAPAPQ